jgi:heat shock protein HtpX
MTRILLFLATNAAILVLISVVFRVLGIDGVLAQNGVDLNLEALLIMSAVIGFGGSFISLALSKTMAKRGMGVKVIDQPSNNTERWLVETVRKQAEEAGIGMPEVGIFGADQPNAFATGMNRNNALVAVSTGLMRSMSPDEVEAVLGHEVAHVANGDMVTMGLMQVFKTERGYGPAYFFTTIVAQIFLSILASMIVMWFSRYREFRADEGGAKLAGREKMISALKALQRAHEPEDLPGQLAAFGINGGRGRTIKSLFMSHPPLEDRIQALESGRPGSEI